eukprot:9980980-Karenia_brevis.AAC.1
MLGTILGSRNSAWLNGTARALAVVFGFNTDVSPNDRLPITPETHEKCCGKACVQKTNSASIAHKGQRCQTMTD